MNGKNQTRRLGLEQLETRATPAVASIALNAGVLDIRADNTQSDITLTTILSPTGGTSVKVTEGANTWSYAKVTRIEFRGGSANDTVNNNTFSTPMSAWGGEGSDTLKGSTGRTTSMAKAATIPCRVAWAPTRFGAATATTQFRAGRATIA